MTACRYCGSSSVECDIAHDNQSFGFCCDGCDGDDSAHEEARQSSEPWGSYRQHEEARRAGESVDCVGHEGCRIANRRDEHADTHPKTLLEIVDELQPDAEHG